MLSGFFFLFSIISSRSNFVSFGFGFSLSSIYLSFYFIPYFVRSYKILSWNKTGFLGFWYRSGFELWLFGLLWSDLAPLRFSQVLQNEFTLQQLMCLVPLNQTQRSYKCLEMVGFVGYGCKDSRFMLSRLRTERLWSLFWIFAYQLYIVQDTNKLWVFLRFNNLGNMGRTYHCSKKVARCLMWNNLRNTLRFIMSHVSMDVTRCLMWNNLRNKLKFIMSHVRLGSGCYSVSKKTFLGLCYPHLVNVIIQVEEWCENKWVLVVYGIDEYLDAVRLWCQWGIDVKIFLGLIKPASSGSMKRYIYYYI